MKAFLPLKGVIPSGNMIAYTSLKQACEILEVPYDSATRGKRQWVKGHLDSDFEFRSIIEIEIVKQKRK